MRREHIYLLHLTWNGNRGSGTSLYTAYERNYSVSIDGKPILECSSDAAFRGDETKYSPEELLVASIAGCHMLWYLHLCSEAGVIVLDYVDQPKGIMMETENGGGAFTEVTLYPTVTVADLFMIEKANELHKKANKLCFIANSVNFPVHHQPVCNPANTSA